MTSEIIDIVTGSLNLSEPWHVKRVEFSPDKGVVDIYVEVRQEADIPCPRCGATASRYGYEPNERTWRHGDCFFYKTFVHCRRPKVVCPKCGVVQIEAPFARKSTRFTLSFEAYAMLILADMPRAKASKVLRCNEKSLASILNYWVDKAVESRSLKDVSQIAVDETSFKRGHEYVTVVSDAAGRRVIDVEEGREKEVIGLFCDKLEKHEGSRNNIVAVTSDMSKSYCPAIKEHFPDAAHVIDKFHVKQLLLNALGDVRKSEQKKVADKKELFWSRRLLCVPETKMTPEQAAQIVSLSRNYPETGRAFRIVAALDNFYRSPNILEARAAFKKLCSWMRRCRLEPMKRAAASLQRHADGIMAYFINRATNAICEGLNSMIQAAKRKARGFNTIKGFTSMIYLVAGKLDLSVGSPFPHFH